MKPLKKLRWKLNWYPKIRKAFLTAALAAGILAPSAAYSVPILLDANKKWAQQKELSELIREPVPESFIADVKQRSLDYFVKDAYYFGGIEEKEGVWPYRDSGEYKEFEEGIKKVSKETGVPRYILAGLVEYCHQCNSGPHAIISWGGRTPVTPEEAGIKGMVLWEDPEQDFLSGAGKFKRLLREVGDELTALILMYEEPFYQVRENIKNAKKEAEHAYACLKQYKEWRSMRSEEELAQYDAIVVQHDAIPMKEWQKRDELEKQLKALFDEITTERESAGSSGDFRGNYQPMAKEWDEDLFHVTMHPKYWKYKCWWVNNLNMGAGAVKIALRLKRDGFQ
ncbi:hypothetical protein KY310_00175 [Candidatus Woesearchaeota archaeon]|nr:hypothetical protein [Candidatus Woesearchaeota archaeon]